MSSLRLLADRRFGPMFGAMFLGAVNDNLFRSAILLHAVAAGDPGTAGLVGQLAGALLVLPFFLFSATAGDLADRFDKTRVMRWSKGAEIVCAALGTLAFASGSLPAMLAVLFLLGTHSTFFGPVKYGMLPERLRPEELVGANALLEAGTFLAILIGTVVGGAAAAVGGLAAAGLCAVAVAVAGWLASLAADAGAPADPARAVTRNPVAGVAALVRHARADGAAFAAILAISWFWAVGAVYLSSFPALLAETMGGDTALMTFTLCLFATGIGCGSFLAERITGGRPGLWLTPLAAAGLAAGSLALWASLPAPDATRGVGLAEFVADPASWAVMAAMLATAAAGGMMVVPLYAFVQAKAPAAQRSRTVAAVNVVNAAFMVASGVAAAMLLKAGFGNADLLLLTALGNLAFLVLLVRAFPADALRGVLRLVFGVLLRVEVRGLEHVAAAGPAKVIAPNHVSLLDGPLLFAYLDDHPAFAVFTGQAERPLLRRLRAVCKLFAIEPDRPLAAKALVDHVRAGGSCVIFPEGRISTTGALMRIYPGAAWIVDKTAAPVVPARIEGPERSPFSRLSPAHLRKTWLPKTRLTFLPPRALEVEGAPREPRRRDAATRALEAVMEDAAFRTGRAAASLPAAVAAAAERHGADRTILTDPLGTSLTYRRLFAAARLLSERFARLGAPGEAVGVLLPTLASTPAVLIGLQLAGRVPAMLNYSAGADGVIRAARVARIRRVVASRAFVAQARLEPVVAALEAEGAELLWLEDVRAAIGAAARLRAALATRFRLLPPSAPTVEPAVLLFTSGSEGRPKAVALGHANLLANVAQALAVLDVDGRDRVLSALPLFHAFGLTGGLVLPLCAGVPSCLYPNPLHYREIPQAVYVHEPTIMFGTDTFLGGYARRAEPYDFRSLKAVFAGAEPLREATRRLWAERFGVLVFEGYGATETGPLLAVNTPRAHRPGTAGRLLPGVEARLEPVAGLPGGRLFVRGPNVMLGYLQETGAIEAPADGWYDTGDVVEIDADGFVAIRGRVKRFAKIGGEMVGLGAVEALAAEVWPDARHAAIAVPDERKGERVVLVSEAAPGGIDRMRAVARERGVAELMLPAELIVTALPLLGSGKTDYPALAAGLAGRARAA